MSNRLLELSSFRDPSGFIFCQKNIIYRQVNNSYKNNYLFLKKTGLLKQLQQSNFLVKHTETRLKPTGEGFLIIKPDRIPFISYPYEWSFTQLKKAALLTLDIQIKSLTKGMSLKDASAYNIQFIGNQPIFIDTLSFEKYREDQPWIAYRQFCNHFLSPLSLMAYTDLDLNLLLQTNVDGISLEQTAKLLPNKAKLNLGLLTHIFLHATAQKSFASKNPDKQKANIDKNTLTQLIQNLKQTVDNLRISCPSTTWGDYYNNTNYKPKSFIQKKKIVEKMLTQAKPKTVLDLGANTGIFSHIASKKAYVISTDIDPVAVEKNYLSSNENILTLRQDIINPSPGIGFDNQERPSFLSRTKTDTTLALALIHHLAISHNIPLNKLANFFSKLSPYLIIEFIPKNDSQTQKLLTQREDIFPNYTQDNFEKIFSKYYHIQEKTLIPGTKRTIYLFKRK